MENWTKDKWQEDELINNHNFFLQIREGFKKNRKKVVGQKKMLFISDNPNNP